MVGGGDSIAMFLQALGTNICVNYGKIWYNNYALKEGIWRSIIK